MNSYEQKQEARRERLEKRAERLQAESGRRYQGARQILNMIPMGQPVLVGHHSEKHHRRDLAKVDNHMRKSIELSKAASEAASAAEAVGTAGISSDDPEAVVKIKAEIAQLEATQARMVAANKLVRKKDTEGMKALGYTEAQIERLMHPPQSWMGQGYPGYALSNNSANIRRLKGRLESLARRDATPDSTEEIGEVTVEITPSENRVRLRFPGKPPREVIEKLKGWGFRWSPTEKAWQRFYSQGAAYWAKEIAGQLAQPAAVS